ncbi:MAG: DUF4012 domain-containing protein [Patescibacteria group bacterium]|nr:DUF4012 domain-containing protein [Patescibacteria group bacterium]
MRSDIPRTQADSISKKDKHILFVEQTKPLSVLVFGFEGILKHTLIDHLTRSGCLVITDLSEVKEGPFSYIFHCNNLNKITKTMHLAYKDGAKFIYISTKERNPQKIKELLKSISAGVKYYLFGIREPQNNQEAKTVVTKLLLNIFTSREEETTGEKQSTLKRPRGKFLFKPRHALVMSLVTLGLSLVLYFGLIGVSFLTGWRILSQMQKEFTNQDLISSQKKVDQTVKLFTFGESLARPVLPVAKFFDYSDAKTIEDSFAVGRLLAKNVSDAIYVMRLAQGIGEAVLSSRTSLHSSQLESLKTEVDKLNSNFAQLLAETKAIPQNSRLFQLFNVKKQVASGIQILEEANLLLSYSKKFTEILPQILGFEEPKTFLLLFQNNSELRPTGGFIGSFGWITFNKGRLVEFKTEDVYTADGQLKGYIAPPLPLKKYLGQENWYLRDSNFDPDFSINAQRAEWFLKREMNLNFDGVFAFDLNSVAEILRGIDGVYLTDYGENITADNLFLKTQVAAEEGFFPGSTQKKDFIGSLTRNIFIKLTSSKIAWEKLLKGMKSSLDEKHTLLYFHNEIAQQIVEEAGWGGRVASISCQQKDCFADYLMVVEANLGINKANFLVDRKAQLNLKPSSGKLIHELLLSYTNESPEKVYPAGSYFSYTRILIPREASDIDLSLSGETIPKEEISFSEYQDKMMVEFPMRINATAEKQVRLVYTTPFPENKLTNLELFVQKQPGIKSYPLEISTSGSENQITDYTISGDKLISLPLKSLN